MPQEIRYDYAAISPKSWRRTPEGFLRLKGAFSRTGLQRYTNPDGSVRVEYRPEEEVASEEAILSIGGIPVTLEHPPELLTPENAREYSRGSTGTHITYSDGLVTGVVTVTDAEAIQKVERGDALELSLGYRVDYDPTPGFTPTGERYDGVQRRISANHLAITRRARAGPMTRLTFDSAEALPPGHSLDVLTPGQPTTPETSMPVPATSRRRNDSPDPWDDDEESTASMEEGDEEEKPKPARRRRTQAKEMEDGGMVSRKEYEDACTERDDALALLEENVGRTDALAERLDALEAELNEQESRFDADAIEAIVTERMDSRLDLLEKASKITGSFSRYDGYTEREIMIEVLEGLGCDPDRFDGRSDEYVMAAFDNQIDMRQEPVPPSVEALERAVKGAARRTDADPIEAASAEMIAQQANAYKQAS